MLLGMLWAVTVNAAAAKRDSEDFFFRQLRSPFERKLKGTRRGCSAYGHSCFGGYGKRGGGGGGGLGDGLGVGTLPLAAPAPLPVPHDQRGGQADADRDADAEPPAGGKLMGLQAEVEDRAGGAPVELRGADADDAALIILRQTPVSSRAPLWGRPLAATRTLRADGGDLDRADRADGEDDADPSNAVANRLFLRRWLRTYRRPAERSLH